MKTLKLLLLLPLAAFAWGNHYSTAPDGTQVPVENNRAQHLPQQYIIQPSEQFIKAQKCANLIEEAKLAWMRYEFFRHHRDEDNGQRKNWERLNKLQKLIDETCEH